MGTAWVAVRTTTESPIGVPVPFACPMVMGKRPVRLAVCQDVADWTPASGSRCVRWKDMSKVVGEPATAAMWTLFTASTFCQRQCQMPAETLLIDQVFSPSSPESTSRFPDGRLPSPSGICSTIWPVGDVSE